MAKIKRKEMFSVSVNDEFKSKEVRFYCRPSDECRTYLKKRRFRWNKADACWYGYAYMEDLTNDIINLGYVLVDSLPEKRVSAKKANAIAQREANRKAEAAYIKEEQAKYEKLGEDGYSALKEAEAKEAEAKAEEDRKAFLESIGADASEDRKVTDNATDLLDFFEEEEDMFDNEPSAPEAPEAPEAKTTAPVPVKAEVIKGVVWVTYDNGMMECL